MMSYRHFPLESLPSRLVIWGEVRRTLRGDTGEHPSPPRGQTMLERTRLSEETLVSPGSASVGFCQACPCRPGVFGHAAPGLKEGSAASTCSSLFLNNGFCCSVMLVDSKRAAVTAVSAQQILTLVEASHRPGQHWGASLLSPDGGRSTQFSVC